MNGQSKDNSGTLWPNLKRKSPKHPSYVGAVQIDGKKYRVSGWWNWSEKNTQDYLALSFSPEEKDGAE